MYDPRPYDSFGRFKNDWLNARHHFSFSSYHDPKRMGWGPLLVWNDDRIAPETGFGMHGHKDMEIITILRRGAITHTDNFGHRGRIPTGEIQVMSAGTGIRHSEWNEEKEETALFQIWIAPRTANLQPRWENKSFEDPAPGALTALVSGQVGAASGEGSLVIDQDATLYAGSATPDASVTHKLGGRPAYLVVDKGAITIGGHSLKTGDAIAIKDEAEIKIAATEPTRFYLADLPSA
jgi:redox-sensitive bicupin YhaK (pirin superfamily)